MKIFSLIICLSTSGCVWYNQAQISKYKIDELRAREFALRFVEELEFEYKDTVVLEVVEFNELTEAWGCFAFGKRHNYSFVIDKSIRKAKVVLIE